MWNADADGNVKPVVNIYGNINANSDTYGFGYSDTYGADYGYTYRISTLHTGLRIHSRDRNDRPWNYRHWQPRR